MLKDPYDKLRNPGICQRPPAAGRSWRTLVSRPTPPAPWGISRNTPSSNTSNNHSLSPVIKPNEIESMQRPASPKPRNRYRVQNGNSSGVMSVRAYRTSPECNEAVGENGPIRNWADLRCPARDLDGLTSMRPRTCHSEWPVRAHQGGYRKLTVEGTLLLGDTIPLPTTPPTLGSRTSRSYRACVL